MNFELLKKLCETPGIAGREDALRSVVISELTPHVTEINTDVMGNVIAFKKGTGSGKKVMIAAHMDEIGFMVKHIDEKGFVRIHPLGGFDPRQMFAQRVKVTTKDGDFPGVLTYTTKPAHMLSDAEKGNAPQIDNFFVDLGMKGEEVKDKVRIGDMVTMDRTVEKCGNAVIGKSMDDRVGVFCMIEAVKQVKDHEVDIYAVATVQEEVGLRGAQTAAFSIEPEVGIALDVTLANDYPGPGEADTVTKLGDGVGIKILDSSLICHPLLVEHFRDLASEKGIKYQMELLPRGGTDAGALQRARSGAACITLSVPCRYVHTVNEMTHETDIEATVELLARYLEQAHTRNYQY